MPEETLEFKIKATDASRAGLDSFARNLKRVDQQQQALNAHLVQAAKKNVEQWLRVAPAVQKVHDRITPLLPALRGVAAGFNLVGRAADANLGRVVMLGQKAHTVFGAMAGPLRTASGILGGIALGATAGAGALAGMGIEANKFRESTIASLTGLLKNKAAATDLFNTLSRFADVTPFDDAEVIEAGKALLTFGFDAKKTLGLVGDVAASMKVPLDQVVRSLARLKAGSFDMSEMAPIGITREALTQHGVRFSKSGEPENRERLLGAGTEFLQRRFGGTMGAASTGFDAISSTVISNIRRVARMATEGLFESLKPAMTSFNKSLETLLANSGAEKLRAALKEPFDAIGKSLEFLAGKLPGFVNSLMNMSGKWGPIWQNIKKTTIDTVKVIGGGIAGLTNILKEFFLTQIQGTHANKAFADSIKQMASASVRSVGQIITVMAALKATMGMTIAGMGALLKNPALVAQGVTMTATGALETLMAGFLTDFISKKIASIDTSKIASSLNPFVNQPGPAGAFARGYVGFGSGVDQVLAMMNGGGTSAGAPGAGAAMPAPAANHMAPGGWVGLASGGPRDRFHRAVTVGVPVPGANPNDPFAPVRLPDGTMTTRWQALASGAIQQQAAAPPTFAPSRVSAPEPAAGPGQTVIGPIYITVGRNESIGDAIDRHLGRQMGTFYPNAR